MGGTGVSKSQAMLTTIFAQETKAEAEAQWEVVADALHEKQPKLGSLMDSSRDDVLDDMDFPREHWAQISSTTPSSASTRRSSAVPMSSGSSAKQRPTLFSSPPHSPTTPPSFA